MIDPATGELAVDGGSLVLGPALTLAGFRARPLGLQAELDVQNGAWESFSVPKCTIGRVECFIRLQFEGQRLKWFSFGILDENAEPYSEDAAVEHATFHDEWLAKVLGKPSHVLVSGKPGSYTSRSASVPMVVVYSFPWGEVSSSYDPRSASANITVRYSG